MGPAQPDDSDQDTLEGGSDGTTYYAGTMSRPMPRAGRPRARLQEGADPEEYAWTVADAAAALGRSVDSVRRYIRQGDLPAGHVSGTRPGEYRLRPADVTGLHDRIHDVIEGGDEPGQEISTLPERSDIAEGERARMHASTPARMHEPGEVDIMPRALALLDTLYQGQLATKDDLIAELRRRAEAAEARASDRDNLAAEIARLQELRAADRERLARESTRLQELRHADRRQMAEELQRLQDAHRAESAELAALRQQTIAQKYQAATPPPAVIPPSAPTPAPAPVRPPQRRGRRWPFWS